MIRSGKVSLCFATTLHLLAAASALKIAEPRQEKD